MDKLYFKPINIVLTEEEINEVIKKGPEELFKYNVTGINEAKKLYEMIKSNEELYSIGEING